VRARPALRCGRGRERMARRPGPARPAHALLSRPADGRLYALDRDRGEPPFGRPPPARRRRPLPRPPARAAPRGPLTSSDAAPLQPRAPCSGRQRFVTQLPLTFDSAGPWDRGNPCPRPNAPGPAGRVVCLTSNRKFGLLLEGRLATCA